MGFYASRLIIYIKNHQKKVFSTHKKAYLKVVIPTTSCRHEKMVFSTPLSEYKVYDQNISKEKTSDNPFQVSNIICAGGDTCGQQ